MLFYRVTTYKVDVISALRKKLKEPSSLTISTEPSNDNDSNKEALNINKVLPTIIELKWDINYVQTLFAQARQKVLQKILESTSITKKCTKF